MKLAGAYINDDTYERLVALAAANNRTLAGECRHLFDRALRGELQVPVGPAAAARGAGPLTALRPPISSPSTQTLAAASRPLRQTRGQGRAIESRPMPGASGKPQQPPHSGIPTGSSNLAQGKGLPQPRTEVFAEPGAAAAVPARWVEENLPVAGEGVGRVPAGNGIVCTPGILPATGTFCPAPGAGGAEAAAKAAPTMPTTTPRDLPDPR
ncbi:MAG: hypothetical protein J0L73_24805 [Verrucomicrobia bacterium]|nr:hypothetical protein [Verrucomicrobiota bacterium]